MSKNNHVGLWNACLDIIRDNVPEQTYKTWFCPIVPLKFEDDTLVLQVPSQFFYEFLEEKFLDLLRQTIHKVFGERTKLMYSVMVVKTRLQLFLCLLIPVRPLRYLLYARLQPKTFRRHHK